MDSESVPEIAGLEAADEAAPERLGLFHVTREAVPPAGVVALPPIQRERAGLELSRIVLGIVAGSILFFGVYLFVVDVLGRQNLAEAYRHVYSQVENGSDAVDTTGIADLEEKLRSAPDAAMAGDEVSRLQKFAESALRAKVVSNRQHDTLLACATDRTPEGRQDCADMLGTASKAAGSASLDLEKIRQLTEFVKTIDEHQRGFQAFWLQLAQLILLNLLLPLLTGLFGYIFGTSQSSAQSRQSV